MSPNNNNRPTVGVVGASGYTGRELLVLLARHPDVTLRFATSRSLLGQPTGVQEVLFTDPARTSMDGTEVIFLCLPHGEAAEWVRRNPSIAARIVDLTADHRPGSGAEEGWVFGMPELDPAAVAGAARVANPGCYPTGVILSLDPLRRAGLLDAERPVIVNAASGVTGAGRTPRTDLLFAEVYGDFRAYGVGNVHRHLKEMKALLPGVPLIFTPHLLPVPRGILETISVPVRSGVGASEVRQAWWEAYGPSPVVRVLPEGVPSLAGVVGSDRLDLAVVDNDGHPGTLTVMAALDNLGKGAAGQAVQNMNLMLGLPAERGVRC
jgi:N-acetyl-gamma-glutamyl-phosphate reductase